MKIMFICTGNICRSAMAHWLLKRKLEEEKIQNIEVYSSGIYAIEGDRPTEEAIEVMEEYGIDIRQHRATNVKKSKIKEMDLLLCATTAHKWQIEYMYPELRTKVYTIKEYVAEENKKENGENKIKKLEQNDIDIKDPWGCGIETYRICVAEIEKNIEMLIKKIKVLEKK